MSIRWRSLYIITYILMSVLYIQGAHKHMTSVNQDVNSWDQDAYLTASMMYHAKRTGNADGLKVHFENLLLGMRQQSQSMPLEKRDLTVKSQLAMARAVLSRNGIDDEIAIPFMEFLEHSCLNVDTQWSEEQHNELRMHISTIAPQYLENALASDRNRMPLYTYFLSLFYNSTMIKEAFFHRAKIINIALSWCLWLIISLFLHRWFSAGIAFPMSILVGFLVFMFKGGFAQAEILFYFLFFLSCVLLTEILYRPKITTGMAAGAVLAAAYMTKASLLPLCIIFFGFATLNVVRLWIRSRDSEKSPTLPAHAIGAYLSVFIVFIIAIFPYIHANKVHFGRWFYNTNSTFYMWCDTWEEAKTFSNTYTDWIAKPDAPKDQIPGPAKYWREHSLSDIGQRLKHGVTALWAQSIAPYPYSKYIVLFPAYIVILSLAGTRRRSSQDTFPLPLSFGISCILIYSILYAWYCPIAPGNRFILSLMLPFLLWVALFLSRPWGWARLKDTLTQKTIQGVFCLGIVVDIFRNFINSLT